MEGQYWQDHPDAPFALLMEIVETYCHPEGALARATEYEDGSQEKFLARLWRDLYPDEPLPRP